MQQLPVDHDLSQHRFVEAIERQATDWTGQRHPGDEAAGLPARAGHDTDSDLTLAFSRVSLAADALDCRESPPQRGRR